MKKIICTVLAFILLILAVSGCAQEEAATPVLTPIKVAEITPEPTPSPTQEPTPSPTQEPTPSPTQEPTPSPTPSGPVSYLTGLPVEDDYVYKPVGVMIENHRASRPQFGLQYADIVYEAPVEGCTRFLCLFNDTLPEVVGPVRSARIYYIKIQQEWDSAYVHFGGAMDGKADCYDKDSDHIKTRIDFIKGKYNDYYWRESEFSAPHNAFTNVAECQTLMDYEPEPRPFNFDETKVYAGEKISRVDLPFYSGTATYKYDEAADVFLRYMDDKEFKDALTDKVITVKNLIIQYHKFYHGNERKSRWLCDQLGRGKAEFFIGGVHVIGTWERESFESITIYKDELGQEIVLRPGNTWIALHPVTKSIIVEY